jgi:hypothetical protein
VEKVLRHSELPCPPSAALSALAHVRSAYASLVENETHAALSRAQLGRVLVEAEALDMDDSTTHRAKSFASAATATIGRRPSIMGIPLPPPPSAATSAAASVGDRSARVRPHSSTVENELNGDGPRAEKRARGEGWSGEEEVSSTCFLY